MWPNGAISITTILSERWLNEHNRLLLAAALLRQQNRQRPRLRRAPYAWRLPRVNGSWFEIHYNNRAIPETFFQQQLRMSYLRYSCEDTRPLNCEGKFAIQSLFMSLKNTCYWIVSFSSWQLLSNNWPSLQCWKVNSYRSWARCSRCLCTELAICREAKIWKLLEPNFRLVRVALFPSIGCYL